MSGSDGGPRGRKSRAGRIAALAALAGLLGWAVPASMAASGSLAEGQATVGSPAIPESGFAVGWAKAGPLRTFTGQDLFNQIDGGAELFLEFGFAKLRLQAYARDKAELTLNAYEMESAASALGIYLMKMGRETPFPEVAARNSGEEAQVTIIKGRYFIQVDNLGDVPASKAEAAALANAFLAGVAEEAAATPLDALPAEGKVPGSERLIRGPYGLQPYFTFGEGDILQLGGRIFGVVANYGESPDAVSLRFIIPYAEEAQAGSVYENLLANLDPYLKVLETREGAFVFEDHRGKFGIVERKGSNLDIRANLDLKPKI
jgi:hypothetical protein